MQVAEFITLAKSTVLAQLSVDDPTLLNFINFGLIEIYKRFPVSVKEQDIPVSNNINLYELKEDCLLIQSVHTQSKYLREESGEFIDSLCADTEIAELPINDESDINSIFTPSFNKILVPYPNDTQVIALIYKASPTINEYDELGYSVLELAPQYIQPLLMYVAYLYHTTYAGKDDTYQDTYLQKYILACDELDLRGLVSTVNTSNLKMEMRGFI